MMMALKAHVKGGRLLLDEPTDLPDGSEVELTLVEDEFDPEERARLDAALDAGIEAARRGDVVDGEVVARELLGQRLRPGSLPASTCRVGHGRGQGPKL
jgi:hypothetical protein